MNNSKLRVGAARPYIIIGLALAAGLVWLLWLYIFVWHNAPHLAQMAGG